MHAGAGREARPGFYFRIECGNFPSLTKSESCVIILTNEA